MWTHLMQSISRNQSFVAAGCGASRAPQDSVTVGAGVEWRSAYEYAQTQNVTLVGGDAAQVGASGGWLMVSDFRLALPHGLKQISSLFIGRRSLFLVSLLWSRGRQCATSRDCYPQRSSSNDQRMLEPGSILGGTFQLSCSI